MCLIMVLGHYPVMQGLGGAGVKTYQLPRPHFSPHIHTSQPAKCIFSPDQLVNWFVSIMHVEVGVLAIPSPSPH